MSRRRLLPGGPVAVVLAPLLLTAWASAATPATATPATAVRAAATSAAPTAAAPVSDGAGIVVSAIGPAELRPGGSVTVEGVVQGGPDGLDDVELALRLAGERSTSVSSLERWTAAVDPVPGPAAGSGFADPAEGARTETVVDVGDVPAGGRVPFEVVVDADDLDLAPGFTAAGAYGLQLRLSSDEGVVDDERGFLLWSPEVDVAPTQLVTTLPLTGPPAQVATGLPDPEELTRQLAPGGRLDLLLEAATALDADWLVQPALLAGLVALAGDEPAAAPGDGTGTTPPPSGPPSDEPAPGTLPDGPAPDAPAATGTSDPTTSDRTAGDETTGDETTGDQTPDDEPRSEQTGEAQPTSAGSAPAQAWLDRLQRGRDEREVVLQPWADPDPTRLRSADDPDDAWDLLEVAHAAALPDEQVEELLDGRVRADVLDATRPGTTAQDVRTLSRGRTGVLLRESAVPLEDPFALPYTPDQVTQVRTGDRLLTAVLSDAGLTSDTAAALGGDPLAVTRVLARLATTSLQRPSDQRVLAVALPEDVAVASGAADALATAIEGSGWAQPVTVSTALGTSPAEVPREPLPTSSGRTPVVGVQPLLDAVRESRAVAAALATPEDPVEQAAVSLRAAATLSRDALPAAPAELAADLTAAAQQTVAGVRVVPGSRITLVAAQAALPVTVVNELDTHVSLVLQVRSRSPRLQVTETSVPVEVDPGQRTVVDVPVVAVASGRAEVVSQLTTADGRDWGPQSEVVVTVATQAEGRVLTGVGIGVAVLFVLGAARAFVRNRRGRELDETGRGQVAP